MRKLIYECLAVQQRREGAKRFRGGFIDNVKRRLDKRPDTHRRPERSLLAHGAFQVASLNSFCYPETRCDDYYTCIIGVDTP